MSTDTTLAVAGVALTIFFGIWGLALARRTRYPGRIAVFYEYCAALFGTRGIKGVDNDHPYEGGFRSD